MDWHKTGCVLCESNCGLEVRLDGRQIVRVRGSKDHIATAGYTCEKALRINHYQNGPHRITTPMRRRPDGEYEEVDWDTAIAEVAAGLGKVRDDHGGDKIFFYGGGGQGNHLGGAYATALRTVLGSKHRSNALAQEKTGESLVDGLMFGADYTGSGGDFTRCEVAVFVGKNPYQSHGFPAARKVLKEIQRDPDRSIIVIDPRRTETADMADFFLQVKPGTDVYVLSAMVATMVQEDLIDERFVAGHCVNSEPLFSHLQGISIAEYAARCGVSEELIRATARRIAGAKGVSIKEDLGVQMAPNSTLNSYLQKLLWVLGGGYGVMGGMSAQAGLVPIFNNSAIRNGGDPRTPVTGERLVAGLLPCNVIPDEILTDHPNRFRAAIIDAANPVHSLADSARMREAIRALEFSVVIDVAFTETARQADYVLPSASQYEQATATFFHAEFPHSSFWIRPRLLDPEPGTLPEAEIYLRLVRELVDIPDEAIAALRSAAEQGLQQFGAALQQSAGDYPQLLGVAPVILYDTLGRTLDPDLAEAAILWFSCQRFFMKFGPAAKRAGHEDADALFTAMLANPDGVMYAVHEYDEAWDLIRTPDGKINLHLPELLDELIAVGAEPVTYVSDEYPFVLAAGERRSFTANTIFRDPSWRKRDRDGALRMNPADASDLDVETGDTVRVSTKAGSARVSVEVNDTLQPGHITLPNGFGLDFPVEGEAEQTGVAPNELTSSDWRDPHVGTPWHKHVPARIEKVPA